MKNILAFCLGAILLYGWIPGPAPAAPAGEKPPVVVEPLRPVDVARPDFVVGNGTPASITLQALQAALLRGGMITFNPGGRPVTLPVTKTLTLPVNTRPTVLDGGGLVTLDGLGRNQILIKGWKTVLTVQRLKFIAARTAKEGAAIKVENWDGALSVIDCQFDNCKTTEPGPDIGGGAIRTLGQKHCQVSGCKFHDCAGSNGGAICSLGSQLTLVNCSFTNCTAFGYGGGMDARPKGKGMGGVGGAVYVERRQPERRGTAALHRPVRVPQQLGRRSWRRRLRLRLQASQEPEHLPRLDFRGQQGHGRAGPLPGVRRGRLHPGQRGLFPQFHLPQ